MISMMRSEQTVNLGMRGGIALMVMILCSAIPPAFAEILQDTRYSYDTVGNIEALTDPLNGHHQQLSYDDLDRLQTANGPYGNYTYQYDAIGNLTVNPQVSATPYTYPTSGPSSVRPHAVTTAGPNSYTYDANGNMETGAGRTIAWNYENKPLTITQGATTTTFVYDGDGGRVKKIVGTTTTRYISKLYECDSNGATTSCSRFIWAGDQRIATVADNGVTHYWHVDHLGSSSVITDGTGAKVETITYYPYGEVRTDTPGTPVNVPYKYTGQERDSSTGLMYYEARYYDPKLGRFISADTIVPSMLDPEALNRYTYARNNPMYYTDPTGHCFIFCFIFIGFAVGAISSGIQSDWDLKATLLGGVIGGASAAAGYATFGPASAAFAEMGLGPITSGIAGGALAGAVAGGVSGHLANLAGYNVNIGLAIASGAAAGGIVGGAGAQFGGFGAFAAAPAAGAAGAAISGADPGMGAAIAAATAAFAFGVQQLGQKLAPAQMSRGGSPSGNTLSMKDVREALDVIGKSSFVADPPDGYTDAPGIAAKLNNMLDSGDISFGQTYREGARAQMWLGKITLNSTNINSGLCPRCDLPGTLFHEGVHAYYGDAFTSATVENRAYMFQYKLEMSLYNSGASMRPAYKPQLYQIR